MEKAEKPTLARALADFVCNAVVIYKEAGQVVFDGDSLMHLTF